MTVAALRSRQEGQVIPLLLVAMLVTLAFGFALFQVGAAARLSTQGQTAADAAALAGAQELKRQVQGLTFSGGGGFGPSAVSMLAIRAAADDYARRNEGRVIELGIQGYDVLVTVRTLNGLGEGARPVEREGKTALTRARARVDAIYGFSIPGPGAVAGGSGGGGANFLSESELRALSEKAGVPVRADSALRSNGGTGNGDGPDVADLQEAMQIAILKAEDLLGGPLDLISGFRTVAYQAALCAVTRGRCATPGQSLHNAGLAIDVANFPALATVAEQAGLCQPFPAPGDDNEHFSLASGPECGGRGGPLGDGQQYGGNPGAFASFRVRLVRYDGI